MNDHSFRGLSIEGEPGSFRRVWTMRHAALLLLSWPPKPKRRAAMKAYIDLLDGKGDVDDARQYFLYAATEAGCHVQKATADLES